MGNHGEGRSPIGPETAAHHTIDHRAASRSPSPSTVDAVTVDRVADDHWPDGVPMGGPPVACARCARARKLHLRPRSHITPVL